MMTMSPQQNRKKRHLGLRRRICRRAGDFATDTDGVSLVEFAFMLPILMIVLLMVVSLSHMMMIDRKVTITAQATADLISQRAAVDSDDIAEFRLAAELMMQPYAPTFDIAVSHVAFSLPVGGNPGGVPLMSAPESWVALINSATEIPTTDVEAAANGDYISKPAGAITGALGTPGDALIMLRMTYTYRSVWVGDISLWGFNIPANLTFTKYTYARPRLNRQIASTQSLMTAN